MISLKNFSFDFEISGAVEEVQDWSDHLKRTSNWQLLVQSELSKYKALTVKDKILGPTKVEVVRQAPPEFLRQVFVWLKWRPIKSFYSVTV